jgi:micrococcal nuclease
MSIASRSRRLSGLAVAVATLVLLAAGACAPGRSGEAGRTGEAPDARRHRDDPASRPATDGTVVRVVDGDTVVVDIDGHDETVRLIGIDTPETKKPNTPVECFGPEATAHLQDLLPAGTAVRVEPDVEARDRYDRLLAYLHRVADGRFVNLAMVADGFANQLTVPPNVAHEPSFRAAAREARDTDRGLWGACPTPHSPA